MTDVEMSDVTNIEFHLSSVIEASKNDIKGIAVTGSNEIITAGREEKIRFFAKRRGEYTCYKEIDQPKGTVVNSLAYYEENGGWLIFAGRKNGSIAVYNQHFLEVRVVTNHSSNVCCLHVDKTNKKLLSGSWDNSVIIWPIEELTADHFKALLLSEHTMSVWALATFENSPGLTLSGSADKTIKLWENDNCIRTFKGHTDVIRCLQVLSNSTFISAANDSTYRVWHVDSAETLHKFHSHLEDFIFSLSLVGKHLISCGETGFIEIWKVEATDSGERLQHKQVLSTPSSTLWTSETITENEFAVASSEGRVYLYSTDSEKKASDQVMNLINELMSEKTVAEITRKQHEANEEIVIKVALDDGTPNLELRYRKGTDPAIAAQNFITTHNLPTSYLNEITDYIVTNIPEARQAQNAKYKKQPTQRITVDGLVYDNALEITIENKKMKLPFNADDDPDMAALRFCEKHNLAIKFAAQFSTLIKSEQMGMRNSTTSEFYDPYTGGGRYMPGQTSSNPTMGADPFTGGGCYIPGSSTSSFSNGSDPFTSDGRYIPGSGSSNLVSNASRCDLRPRCELVPLTEFYLFKPEKNLKAVAKLKESNQQQEIYKLNPQQLEAMEQLLVAEPGTIEVGEVEQSALDLGLLWSFNDIGIIIDLLRCAMLYPSLNQYFCDLKGKGAATRTRLFEILVSNPTVAVKAFTCRAIANIFKFPEGQEMMADSGDFAQLVSQVANCYKVATSVPGGKQLHMAAASALGNWSFLFLQRSQKIAELGPREDVLRAIISALESIDSFGDKEETANIRMLQAIVTLMWGDKQTAKNRNIVSIVNKMKDAVPSDIGKNVARCIVAMTESI